VCRLGVGGDAVRVEKLFYVSKEGRNDLGCPIAKWVGELHTLSAIVTANFLTFWHHLVLSNEEQSAWFFSAVAI